MTKMYFLTDDNIDLAYAIRKEVFIKEQNVPKHIEMDGSDKRAKNMILELDNKPIGTARLIEQEGKMYIGRVAILNPYRKKGYASKMIKFLLDEAKKMGYNKVFIHSQCSAKGFYEKLGFIAFGDEFLDANILHINMKIDLKQI